MSHFSTLLIGMVTTAFATVAGFSDDDHVALRDVPAAAVKAVKDRFPDAQIRDRVERDTKRTGVYYDFDLLRNGKKIDVEVSAEGKFSEIEIDLDAADLPKVVADAIAARFPGGKVTKAKEDIEFHGEVENKIYKVDVATSAGRVDAKVTPDGKIFDVDHEDDDD